MTASLTSALPYLGVATVPEPYVHLVRAGRQHGETAGDGGRRPLHRLALLPAHEHAAVVVPASQVRALDGENLSSCARGIERKKENEETMSSCHSSAEIMSTCPPVSAAATPSVLFAVWEDIILSQAQIVRVS